MEYWATIIPKTYNINYYGINFNIFSEFNYNCIYIPSYPILIF